MGKKINKNGNREVSHILRIFNNVISNEEEKKSPFLISGTEYICSSYAFTFIGGYM